MQKTFSIFYSRTFWLIILMFVINGGNAIIPMLPPTVQLIMNALLSLAATYTHINPSQPYNQGSIKEN